MENNYSRNKQRKKLLVNKVLLSMKIIIRFALGKLSD